MAKMFDNIKQRSDFVSYVRKASEALEDIAKKMPDKPRISMSLQLKCQKCGTGLYVNVSAHYSRVPLFNDGFDFGLGKCIESEEEPITCECGWQWYIDCDDNGLIIAKSVDEEENSP